MTPQNGKVYSRGTAMTTWDRGNVGFGRKSTKIENPNGLVLLSFGHRAHRKRDRLEILDDAAEWKSVPNV